MRVTLETLANFQWLDDKQTWFHLESGSQYGLPNVIDKVLAVCPRIAVARLRGDGAAAVGQEGAAGGGFAYVLRPDARRNRQEPRRHR